MTEVFCSWSVLQALAEEFSEYVYTAKSRLADESVLSTIRAVMLMCTQSISCVEKVGWHRDG